MDANDSGALQLVLFNKRVMTQHKSKWIGPSQREEGICRGARAWFCNRDKLYFYQYTFIVNVTSKRWRYLPCYTHYRQFPNRMVKFILPLHQSNINPWLARNNECLQLTTVPGEFCLQLFWFDLHKTWDWASRWPAIFSWVRSGVHSSWE